MLTDEQTTVENVLHHISTFQMRWRSSIEEKHIEAALLKYLREHYLHVENQYPLATGVKADLRVGRGIVHVELKLAKSLEQMANRQRLYGQMIQYKFTGANGLVAVAFGTKKDAENRPLWQEMQECLAIVGVPFLFVEMPSTPI